MILKLGSIHTQSGNAAPFCRDVHGYWCDCSCIRAYSLWNNEQITFFSVFFLTLLLPLIHTLLCFCFLLNSTRSPLTHHKCTTSIKINWRTAFIPHCQIWCKCSLKLWKWLFSTNLNQGGFKPPITSVTLCQFSTKPAVVSLHVDAVCIIKGAPIV